jgi:uncharacterized surface protein with fasciclin (FAS1) repeats
MMSKINRISTFAVLLVFAATSCTSPETEAMSTKAEMSEQTTIQGQSGVQDDDSEKNILQVALGSPDHTTLVAGVQAAGLADVLTNAGPLTVFAPTNEAFGKLPEGTLETLLKPENKAQLADIITFHAAPGSYNENNIKGVMGIGQATGDKVEVTVEDGVTYVNGAKVLGSVKASNGYVHVIDAVLLPPPAK